MQQSIVCYDKTILVVHQEFYVLRTTILFIERYAPYSFLNTRLHLRFSSFSGNFFIFTEFESKCCIKRGKLIVHTMRRRDVNNLDQGVQILGYHMKSHRDYYQVICNEQSLVTQYSAICSVLCVAQNLKFKI